MPIDPRIGPVMAHITYEHGNTLKLNLWSAKQVEDLITGLTTKSGGFYGFTDPGETFQRVAIAREGIIFIQIFGTPETDGGESERD